VPAMPPATPSAMLTQMPADQRRREFDDTHQ
jgi:hypothetical protein